MLALQDQRLSSVSSTREPSSASFQRLGALSSKLDEFFHPMTLSSCDFFIQSTLSSKTFSSKRHFHSKTVSSTNGETTIRTPSAGPPLRRTPPPLDLPPSDRSKFRPCPSSLSPFPSLSGGLLVELWTWFKTEFHIKCAFGLLWGHSV